MTIEEIAELFLAHLYDLAEAAPHPNFLFSVNDFAPRYGVEKREDLQAANHYLGDRGLIILASLDMFGTISAGITMDGSVFVEKGGETGIIGRYRKDPQSFIVNLPERPPEPVAAGTVETTYEEKRTPLYTVLRAVDALLLDIEEILEKDDAVPGEIKKDLLSDLATLKIQVSRNVKNKAVIGALLDNLSSVRSIAPLVTGLNSIVEAYFE
jgi:hypothetical protein